MGGYMLDVIALHIVAQNAGLIMRHTGQEIQFESFEVSPTAGAVMNAKGRLTCSFPGPVIAVPAEKIQGSPFLNELVTLLEQLDRDELEDAMPTSKKAGSRIVEERDTASPMFVTEMLIGILRGIGRPVVDGSGRRIQKQVRDDVLWNSACLPWRRSPLWLVVRVAIQTTVQHKPGVYKSFMIFLMSKLLALAQENNVGSDTLFTMRAKLSRRVEKAGTELPKFVLREACRVVQSISKDLANS
jgi:hypothetical protein